LSRSFSAYNIDTDFLLSTALHLTI
jgi:hypothetical protein